MIMARVGIMKTNPFFSSRSRHAGEAIIRSRWMSKKQQQKATTRKGEDDDEELIMKSSYGCWKPDDRTGIYIPEGQERVMEDVPNGAASFKRTYWVRSIDGVDKPPPF